MSRFQDCLPHILASEGGYVNHPNDRGGATNMGITQRVFEDWCKLTGRPVRNVQSITRDEVEIIYKSNYWIPAKCDQMHEPLDLLQFDAAVNHGPKRAMILLQRALAVEDDGVFGMQTYNAMKEEIDSGNVEMVCKLYLDERRRFYDAIVQNNPSQTAFIKGWMNRVDRLEKEIA